MDLHDIISGPVKTSIRIPRDIHRKAKILAAEGKIESIKAVCLEALRKVIKEDEA